MRFGGKGDTYFNTAYYEDKIKKWKEVAERAKSYGQQKHYADAMKVVKESEKDLEDIKGAEKKYPERVEWMKKNIPGWDSMTAREKEESARNPRVLAAEALLASGVKVKKGREKKYFKWKTQKDSPWRKDKIKLVKVSEIHPLEQNQDVTRVEKIKVSGDIRKPIDVFNKYVGKSEARPKSMRGEEDELGMWDANPKKYQLYNGHHRWRAALERGDEKIPAKVAENPFQRQEWRRRKGLRS